MIKIVSLDPDQPLEGMPDKGEGEESILPGKIINMKDPWPLDPQEHPHPRVVHLVARAPQVLDTLLIQTRDGYEVLKPCSASTLQITYLSFCI